MFAVMIILDVSKNTPERVNCVGGLLILHLRGMVSSLQVSDLSGWRQGAGQEYRGMPRSSLPQKRVIVGAQFTQRPSYPRGERAGGSFLLTQYT